MTREDLVRLARDVVTGTNRPTYCANPAAFDPHEWVLEAMQSAYDRGYGQCHLDRIREESKMLDRQREDMCPENTGRG